MINTTVGAGAGAASRYGSGSGSGSNQKRRLLAALAPAPAQQHCLEGQTEKSVNMIWHCLVGALNFYTLAHRRETGHVTTDHACGVT
jgi:hypothetical protein